MKRLGSSLAVQYLRLLLPMKGVWVRSLVGELRSHRLHGQKPEYRKRNQHCNTFNKVFQNGTHTQIFKKEMMIGLFIEEIFPSRSYYLKRFLGPPLVLSVSIKRNKWTRITYKLDIPQILDNYHLGWP